MDDLVDLLQNCTVKIQDQQSGLQGTGFFVAPGQVLTCAHVVKKLTLGDSVELRTWDENTHPATLVKRSDDRYPDVALLQTSYRDHPCVRLVRGRRSMGLKDALFTFGYSRTEEDFAGIMVTLEYDGPAYYESAANPFLNLKQGQMAPGLSGGPLVHASLCRVVGIASLSNDERYPFGGQAIPIEKVLEFLPEVEAANMEFHARDDQWQQLESVLPSIETSEARALVVGVGMYQDRSERYAGCTEAAKTLNELLMPRTDHIACLTHHRATTTQIRHAIQKLFAPPMQTSNFIFWSSAICDGWPYRLHCYDTPGSEDEDACVSIKEIKSWLHKLQSCDHSVFMCLDLSRLPTEELLSLIGPRSGLVYWKNRSSLPSHKSEMSEMLQQVIHTCGPHDDRDAALRSRVAWPVDWRPDRV